MQQNHTSHGHSPLRVLDGVTLLLDKHLLHLVAQGLTDAQVADALVISPRTVNAHLRSIYNKLGITSRHAATLFAIKQQLI